ncbi:zinc-binding dehydrogenase [Komagataeibacter melomenusus]
MPILSHKPGLAIVIDNFVEQCDLHAHSARLFGWIIEGRLAVHIGGTYLLADTACAHASIKSRKTIGKLLLLP